MKIEGDPGSPQAPEAGQVEGTPEGTTPPTPAPVVPGHAEGTEGAPASEPTPPVATGSQEDYFFDRKGYEERLGLIPEEQGDLRKDIEALVKSLQGDYTRKSQSFSQQRQKVEAVDLFEQGMRTDPQGTLRQLASRYGLNMDQPGQAHAAPQEEVEPGSWEEVYKKAAEIARVGVLEEIKPFLGQMQSMQSKTVEAELDQIDPNWRRLEDKMSELMTQVPGLSNLPLKDVYQLARDPAEVKAEALAEAHRQLAKETAAGTTHGSTPPIKTSPGTKKIESFQDAIDVAKQKLAEGGHQ